MDPLSRAIRVAGIKAHTLQDAVDALLQLPAPEQYEELTTLKDNFFAALDDRQEKLAILCDIVDNPAIQKSLQTHLSASKLRLEWREAREIRTQYRKSNEERIKQAHDRVSKAWGKSDTDRIWLYVKSRRTADHINTMVTSRLTFLEARLAINNESITRLANTRKGLTAIKETTSGDFQKAALHRCLRPIPPAILDEHHVIYDKEGFITRKPGKPKPRTPRQNYSLPTDSNDQQVNVEATSTGMIDEPLNPQVVLFPLNPYPFTNLSIEIPTPSRA